MGRTIRGYFSPALEKICADSSRKSMHSGYSNKLCESVQDEGEIDMW